MPDTALSAAGKAGDPKSAQPPSASTIAPRRSALRGTLGRLLVFMVAGGIAALFAVQWDRWIGGSLRQSTNDAYVRSDVTPLSAKVEGYVTKLAVDDFQQVKAGDLLVEIDDRDYQAVVEQAEANVSSAHAAIDNVRARKSAQYATVAEAEAAVTATQADVDRTRLEAIRQRELLATTFGTVQRVEQADADEKRFAATLASRRAALDDQARQLTVFDAQEAQLRADLKAKQAVLDLAKINLGYTKIVAPIDGMVGERGVRVGQYAHAGTQVIAVVPLDKVWIIANYKETQLTHVEIGQDAEIRVDTFPGVVIGGSVDSISPASGSQFSLLPPDNATGNFTKVVQRIPVKVRIKPDNPLAGRLRPGMSVEVTILTATTPPI
jgi:membrane fusion protein (multidrug efflux system)